MLPNVDIRCNGYWLSTLGAWGDVVREEQADGGCWSLSWSMDLPPDFDHPAVRRGALVELMDAGRSAWAGLLTEPDRSEWSFTALGVSRAAESFIALSGTGTTTSIPDTAITVAINKGLPWHRLTSIGTDAVTTGDATDGVNYLHTVLDAHSDLTGRRWGVGGDRVVYSRADPTTPKWLMTPGSGTLGIADDDYATHLVGRYRSSTTTYATITVGNDRTAARWGRREHPVDLTGRGVISSSTAQSHLTNLLAKIGPRPGWANGVDPAPGELLSTGGIPANPFLVRAGDGVRLFGVYDEDLQPTPYVDFVIGSLRHELNDGTLRLEPTGMADRDLSSIIASANDPTAYKG